MQTALKGRIGYFREIYLASPGELLTQLFERKGVLFTGYAKRALQHIACNAQIWSWKGMVTKV